MAELKIKADSGGGTVSFKGPATTTSNAAVQLTLPVDDGAANTWLKSNGSGVTSWAAPTATEIATSSGTAGSGTFLRGDNTWAEAGGGKILQVVSADSSTVTQFVNQTSYGDNTNHNITITPTESGSKIVLLAQWRFTVIKSAIEATSKWRIKLTIGSNAATYPLGVDINQTIEAGTSTNSRTHITTVVPVNYTTGATSNTSDAYVFQMQAKNDASSNDSECQSKYWRAIAMEVAA